MPAACREGFPHAADAVFYEGDEPFKAALPLLSDETHFLHLTGPHGFSPKWDARLLALEHGCPRAALLTASVSPPVEGIPAPAADPDADTRVCAKAPPAPRPPVPPEACLPALADRFEDGAAEIVRGLPLVCAAGPVRTLVADPALVFGPVRFLREADLALDTLSIAAYVAGYAVFALPGAPLWPLREPPRRWLRRPVPDALPGTTLSRFEQLAGFRYDQRRAGVRTTWGLFGVENTYPQRLPYSLRLAQRTRAARMRLSERYMPLLVTAFIDLPRPRRPVAAYILRFGFLKAVESLPLLLYTGGAQERLLRAGFPNTQSYPDNAVLPRALLNLGMSRADHFLRSKPLLLRRAASRRPDHAAGGHGHPAPSRLRRGRAVLFGADGRAGAPGHGGRRAGPQLRGGAGGPPAADLQLHAGADAGGRRASPRAERGGAVGAADSGGAGPVRPASHAPAKAAVSDRL